MDTVKIASIDPGQDTGLAIATMCVEGNTVILRHEVLVTLEDPYAVEVAMQEYLPPHIVLEMRAFNGDRVGTEPFDIVLTGLFKLGYVHRQHFQFGTDVVSCITPGVWKPIMKSKRLPDIRGSWEILTRHERDALNLLHYAVVMNHMQREISYG
jgi:hypothetical protein